MSYTAITLLMLMLSSKCVYKHYTTTIETGQSISLKFAMVAFFLKLYMYIYLLFFLPFFFYFRCYCTLMLIFRFLSLYRTHVLKVIYLYVNIFVNITKNLRIGLEAYTLFTGRKNEQYWLKDWLTMNAHQLPLLSTLLIKSCCKLFYVLGELLVHNTTPLTIYAPP